MNDTARTCETCRYTRRLLWNLCHSYCINPDREFLYVVDERGTDGNCGPKGKLWEKRDG